jgi:succinoglycan biosynthesis transport protein ExoP
MDLSYLLNILARRKWLILGVMAAAALATFFFIGQKPERFKSSVVMATGIVNYKGIKSDNSDAFVQQYQVDNAFSNLLEFAQSRAAIKLVTIEMLQHDLSAEYGKSTETPFRQPNHSLASFSQAEKQNLYAELEKIQLDSLEEASFSPAFDFLLDKVARTYGYDNDAILRSLSIKRKAQTDYLDIAVTTETPALSQHLANSYSKRFLTYYFNLLVRDKRQNVESYTKLANEKKAVVDSISDLKFEYLKQKGLPVLGKQSEELVGQITKLEFERQRAAAKKMSAAESVNRIKKYEGDRESRDAREIQTRVLEKNNTAEQMERVRDLTRRNAEAGGKNEELAEELATAKSDLDEAMRASARSQGRPRNEEGKKTREDLYKDRVDNDLDRIEAEESYKRISSELYALKNKLGSMVVSDEVFSRLQAEQDNAQLEFDKINDEFIKAKLTLENAENPLSVVQNGQLPEWPEPDRRTLLSLFAAIVVGSLTVIALFGLAYMDSTIQSPDLFKKYTEGLPLLATIPTIPVKGFDLERIFMDKTPDTALTAFRESLRKLRGQVIASGGGNFLIVSTKVKEGKTFLMLSLAHSLAFNNKRVLMIDTNFKAPLPETFTDQPSVNKNLLNKAIQSHGLSNVFQLKTQTAEKSDTQSVDILGNTGIPKSPAELLDPAQFRAFLAEIHQYYDYVLMEAAALNPYSDAQELVPFADKVLAVFNAHSVLKNNDKESIQLLRALSSQFLGAVLTEVAE